MRTHSLLIAIGLLVASTGLSAQTPTPHFDPADWPMYNHDVRGHRHNTAEKTLSPDNVANLVELWRFPVKHSDHTIGTVHMTPAVVDGKVYFGTATDAAFYKLDANGQVLWEYRNDQISARPKALASATDATPNRNKISLSGGFVASPLVWQNTVYIGDIDGVFHALDAKTGQLRWRLDTRGQGFPDSHDANAFFASAIPAAGQLIVAGGAYEHTVAAEKGYQCCRGRGFVMALDPANGDIKWKYDVGPKPIKFDPPLVVKDSWGKHTFHYGPSTSSVWCTPSYDEKTQTLFFGTDVHNAPRRPTTDDPCRYTPHSAAIIALDVRSGQEKWIMQLNPNDVWNLNLRGYQPGNNGQPGQYKDQSIGDTPKLYTLALDGKPTQVLGVGCKNGGFYVLGAHDGRIHHETPRYQGPPQAAEQPTSKTRVLALPGLMGGIQTGCACDGKSVYVNGTDFIGMGTASSLWLSFLATPSGGRVTALSLDTRHERWRHERPRVGRLGDPVASGIALANGVAYFTTTISNQLVLLRTCDGKRLREIDPESPVWSGPAVSRGRVYVGTGNALFAKGDPFPKRYQGQLICYGLPSKTP